VTAPATAGEPRFEAREVSRVYAPGRRGEVQALAAASVAIPSGGFCAVAGPSGCGKTTLLRLLAALDRPSAGDVLHDGRSLARVSEAQLTLLRRRLGLVFQEPALIRRLPVWENVAYPLVPRGISRGRRRTEAFAALDLVGIEDLARKRPENLSGGERRRVGLARALVTRPDAVVADEPTAHLDDATARDVVAVLERLRGEGVTLVVASHRGDVLGAADQVVVLDGGG
jgi:ABC-type lipoprotein export system ATPase subunit